MTSSKPASTDHNPLEKNDFATNTPPAADAVPQAQTAHWSALFVRGDMRWPTDLTREANEELCRTVRELQRLRLVRLIARQIAASIVRGNGEGDCFND